MNQRIITTTLKNTLCLFFLLALISCNKTGNGAEADGGGVTDLFTKKELPQTTIDSLYIKGFLQKESKYKAYEDYMYKFYGDRDYRLAWFRDNKPVPEMERFLSAIDQSSQEGLNPNNYRIDNLKSMLQQYQETDSQDSSRIELQEKLDVALTASYFNYASDFYRGRVDPRDVSQIDWGVKPNKIKLHKALQTILKERESTYPYYEFEALHKGYADLRDALQKYRALEKKGGWTKITLSDKKMLKKGDTAIAVLQVRQRLNPEQKFNVNDPKLRLYDEGLEKQVKHFQMLHGLTEDGVIGGKTLANMNVSVEQRIDQIMINMERWRWIPKRLIPKELDQKYIWVNIPEYKLYIYEDPDNRPDAERQYKEVMSMKVIVGKTLNSTPIFSDKIEYVVMAPYWNLPNSIVANEVKPAMLRNSGYLDRNNMEIVTKEKNPKPISISSIDWSNVTEKNFPYMIRQKPGPKNSLGMIKFLFPNEHAVYLHDTPADALFSQTERGFSHGCVRLEQPVELAKYLLKDMPEWNESKIRRTMTSGTEEWVTLPKEVQVYLVYFTSWVDAKGQVHFREDIYGHDKKLQQEYFS
jgi:L,D-transpeptidase YcbB